MTGPGDRPPWSVVRRRSCARPPDARLRGRTPVACTRQSLLQGDSRSRYRCRDPSLDDEQGPRAATGRSARVSRGVLRDLQETLDDACRTLPLRFFVVELLAPGACQRVDPHATAALGRAPFGRNPPHLLQLEQRRIQSALVECELIAADLFDSPGDPIPV